MTEQLELTGQCMCGAVRFTATVTKPSVVACHCDMCRRWSAGPYMALNCEPVTFEDEENVGTVRSSEWAERGFCKSCGSNLFYHLIGKSDYQMAAGLFDDQSAFRFSMQYFSDRKPDFYSFANETKMMTEEEVFAIYAPKED